MAITLNGSGSITGLSSGAGISASALSGQVPDANAPSGSVLQVVNAIHAPTTVTTTSTTPVTSGLSVSITPSSASNKIFILFSSYGVYVPSGQLIGFLYRNGSDVTPAGRGWFDAESFTGAHGAPVVAQAYDSPSSTSAQTYTVYFRSATGSNCYLLNNGPNLGSLQLVAMEIAA